MEEPYYILLVTMSILAVIVFVALYVVEAGYGYLFNPKYGPPISNRAGWILMESPVLIAMVALWWLSGRGFQSVELFLFALFSLHYIQRSFIFPFLMRGESKMPLGIVVMGMVFNVINAVMQGGWLFYVAPAGYYDDWFSKPYIYIGTALFFAGMATNIHSDHIIRNLRKPGDKRHYIPMGGAFRWVSSANYFGEILEWIGFAIASWSLAGLVFVWWSVANLVPRSAALYRRYEADFGDEFRQLKRKRIFPYIY